MPLPESDFQNIRTWIRNCDRLHPDCPPPPNRTRRLHEIPSWVLDLKDGRIVPGSTASRYVALSYVWPAMDNEKVTLELWTGNLRQFQKHGFLDSIKQDFLPRVISDTIELVKDLGERYLWIDRLCIVQDGQMKRSEIENMDNIYSGADFTIIAAASSGLYVDLDRPHEPMGFSLLRSYLYNKLLKSKWATRGWTFQEQVLSRRAVIFVDGDVFWDCGNAMWSRESTDPRPEANRGYSARREEQLDGHEMAVAMPPSVFPDFRLWRELVCLYSGRELTYPQDVLSAFTGIVNALSETFPGGFVGGLPVLFLDSALLWQPFSKGKRRTWTQGRSEDADMPKTNLPSWSWCGWHAVVDPSSLHVHSLEWLRPELRTKPLVEWSVLSEDLRYEKKLPESRILEDYCRRFLDWGDWNTPRDWSRHDVRYPPRNSTWAYSETHPPEVDPKPSYAFTHSADPTKLFSHPIPMASPGRKPTTSTAQNWPYLHCETTTGLFKIESILTRKYTDKPKRRQQSRVASLKVPVTSLDKFRYGPEGEEMCRVVSLADAAGRPAGLLRIMDDDNDNEIKPGQGVELMAISTGSMGWEEVSSSYEENVDIFKSFSYKGGNVHMFEQDPPLDDDDDDDDTDSESSPLTFRPRRAVVVETAYSQTDRPWACGDEDYRFYNVLWIERRGEVAYRRAAGRVVKGVWEANCREKSRVVLG
ncbi:heterokaryon incompatibility protein-domain-containing protein [Cercophora samala]|uniref:Heterokaryon incompatibility protein-domain-containing protein n=1 Tax=Cercophora samala TaxID=330535 RepID=A0AA39ZBE9_9PEZI|nr:heterokaryon incompatibility protein-domain-containing protein [Cercophora samala]